MMNIAGLEPVIDPNYRYKMPKLVAKIEGRGNGIKTVVDNCSDIALSLDRSAGEVIKFFGCDLGAQSKYSEDEDKAIVNGAHTTPTLQQKLSVFIEKFVLCKTCKNPETRYKIKNEEIFQVCAACGEKGMVDMTHKLCTFIIKDYKTAKKEMKKEKEGDKKKKKDKGDDDGEKKKKKDKKEKKDKDGETKEEKAERKAKKAAKKAKKAAKASGDGDDGSEDESIFQHGDEVAADDDDETIDGLVSQFKSSLKVGQSAKEVVSEVVRFQTISSLSIASRLDIFVRGVFDKDMRKQIPDRAEALNQLVSDADSQLRLICVVEKLTVEHPSLVKPFPLILKALYDEDVLEEAQLLAWGTADAIRGPYSSKTLTNDQLEAMRTASRPFMDWLEQAEEDGSDEDGSDDDSGSD